MNEATVEEILLAMKDTSELMVDLAYSGVFYNSEGIAREVQGLEEDMGAMLNEIQRRALQAVRDDHLPIDHAMALLRVSQAAEVIANSALEIADVVLRDVEPHPVLAQAIHESDSIVTKVVLGADSEYAEKTLGELELESETGMRVLAIKRSGRWRIRLTGNNRLLPGDLLIAAGPEDAEEEFLAAAAPS